MHLKLLATDRNHNPQLVRFSGESNEFADSIQGTSVMSPAVLSSLTAFT